MSNAYDDLKAENERLRAALDEAVEIADDAVLAILPMRESATKRNDLRAESVFSRSIDRARAFIDKHGERK